METQQQNDQKTNPLKDPIMDSLSEKDLTIEQKTDPVLSGFSSQGQENLESSNQNLEIPVQENPISSTIQSTREQLEALFPNKDQNIDKNLSQNQSLSSRILAKSDQKIISLVQNNFQKIDQNLQNQEKFQINDQNISMKGPENENSDGDENQFTLQEIKQIQDMQNAIRENDANKAKQSVNQNPIFQNLNPNYSSINLNQNSHSDPNQTYNAPINLPISSNQPVFKPINKTLTLNEVVNSPSKQLKKHTNTDKISPKQHELGKPVNMPRSLNQSSNKNPIKNISPKKIIQSSDSDDSDANFSQDAESSSDDSGDDDSSDSPNPNNSKSKKAYRRKQQDQESSSSSSDDFEKELDTKMKAQLQGKDAKKLQNSGQNTKLNKIKVGDAELDLKEINRIVREGKKNIPTIKTQMDKILGEKNEKFDISEDDSSSDNSSSEDSGDEEPTMEAIRARFKASRSGQKPGPAKKRVNRLGFEDCEEEDGIERNISMIETSNKARLGGFQSRFDDEFDDDMDEEAYMAAGDDRDMNDMLDDEYDDFNNMGEDGSSEENEAGGLGFEEIIRRNNSRHLEEDDEDDDLEHFSGFGSLGDPSGGFSSQGGVQIRNRINQSGLGTGGQSLGTRQFQAKRVILDQFGLMQRSQQQDNKLLPPVSKLELESINEAIVMATNMPQHMKGKFVAAIKEKNYKYIGDLHTIFCQLDEKRKEEIQDISQQAQDGALTLNQQRMTSMSLIFKSMILLGDAPLTDILLSEKYFMTTFGALELLPEIHGKLGCKSFFENVEFKQIIPIANKAIVNKIHVCYRANYLRETIFAKDDGPAPQSLAFLNFNHTIEVMTHIFNNVDYLKQVVHAAQYAPQLSERGDAIQFLLDLVTQFKTYQQCLMQNMITIGQPEGQPGQTKGGQSVISVPELLVNHIDTFEIVMRFFQSDKRVELACEMAFPTEEETAAPAAEPQTKIPDPIIGSQDMDDQDMMLAANSDRVRPVFEEEETEQNQKSNQEKEEQKQMHHRFPDQTIYDTILARLIEVINMLLTALPKETVKKFVEEGESLAMILAQHVFFAPEEILRSQIVELFKSLLDLSGAGKDSIQFKVEQILVRALLKPFLMLLNRGGSGKESPKSSIFSNQNDDAGIRGILVGPDFANQSQQVFELMQLMCKPQINSLVVEPRTGVTQVMVQFIKEFNLTRISLGVFYEEKNSILTRMMALKFFKSLFALDDKELLIEMCRAEPILHCLPTIQGCQIRQNKLNMFHSSVLDLFNVYGIAVHKHFGSQFHDQMLAPYKTTLAWSTHLIDKFWFPTGRNPKQTQKTLKQQTTPPTIKPAQSLMNQVQANMVTRAQAAQQRNTNSFQSASQLVQNNKNKTKIKNQICISIQSLVLRDFINMKDMTSRIEENESIQEFYNSPKIVKPIELRLKDSISRQQKLNDDAEMEDLQETRVVAKSKAIGFEDWFQPNSVQQKDLATSSFLSPQSSKIKLKNVDQDVEMEDDEFVDASSLASQMKPRTQQAFKFVSAKKEKLPIQPQLSPDRMMKPMREDGTWSDGDTEPDEHGIISNEIEKIEQVQPRAIIVKKAFDEREVNEQKPNSIISFMMGNLQTGVQSDLSMNQKSVSEFQHSENQHKDEKQTNIQQTNNQQPTLIQQPNLQSNHLTQMEIPVEIPVQPPRVSISSFLFRKPLAQNIKENYLQKNL